MARARYKQIVDNLATRIRQGCLAPGTQLPTHRELARREGIALVTASRVYAELEAMGLVSGETGRGTFVRDTSLPPGHGVDQHAVDPGVIDLNFNSPLLPGQTDALRDALRQLASSGDLERLLHYQPHAGRQHERECLARHLELRGLRIDANQLLITSGAQHGLATSVLALLSPGDVVATDALIYPGFKTVAEVHRLELAPIPFTDAGPDLDALAQLCRQRRVKAVYTMPTLHNPLGWVLDLKQRQRLIAIARQQDLLIIEDAAYAFHADIPPPPLAALAPERTVYVSGLSKNIATGLRIGVIAAPAPLVARIERVIRATTWNTPGLLTALTCRWIEDGSVVRLENAKRADAQRRQEKARQIFAGLTYRAHPNAYLLWLPLPEEVRADRIAADLLHEGISVSTAEPFAVSAHYPQALRLALGSVSFDKLEPALTTVRRVIDRYAY